MLHKSLGFYLHEVFLANTAACFQSNYIFEGGISHLPNNKWSKQFFKEKRVEICEVKKLQTVR